MRSLKDENSIRLVMPALDSMACSNSVEEPVVRRKEDLGLSIG